MSAVRKAWIVSSLRLKKCHCPAFWLLINPARCQVGRHGRLGQAAALVDLPGADAVFVVVQLLGELHFRVFQPSENVSPYWVRQGFYYFVEVDGHGSCSVS